MATNNSEATFRGGEKPRVYPVSLQQAAAAIFDVSPFGEQRRGASALAINPLRKSDRENQ